MKSDRISGTLQRKQLLKKFLNKVPGGYTAMRYYFHLRTDCYVISYPKCGRTWLRVMLAKALAEYFDVPGDVFFDPIDILKAGVREAPRIRFLHDKRLIFDTSYKPKEDHFARYKNKKIIFMCRDPRDVIVSHYFHRSHREHEYSGDLSSFIRDEVWGIDNLIKFINTWTEHEYLVGEFFLLRYEDLYRNPETKLRQILQFMGLGTLNNDIISQSVQYASFEHMRKLANEEECGSARLAPTDVRDPDSYKVRRGEIGGHRHYLSAEDRNFLNERIRKELSPSLGYK